MTYNFKTTPVLQTELKMKIIFAERNQCTDASVTLRLDPKQYVAFRKVDGDMNHRSTHHASFIVSNHGVVAARHPSQLSDLKSHVKPVRKSIIT